MSRIVRAGLIQTSCDWPVTEYTMPQIKKKMIAKNVALIEKAAKEKVRILSLQEIFYGPYFCAEQDVRWYDIAEPIPGPTVSLMQKLAKKYAMVIIVPIYETPAVGTYYTRAFDGTVTLWGRWD